MPKIKYHRAKINQDALFSILIPTWNNLSYLKLCIQSIQKSSAFKHEVILHINEGKDGTVEWAHENGFSYAHSSENIGVSQAMNAAASLASTDYILFLNDDMYVCPNWDQYLYDEIQALKTPYFFLSATLIEPALAGRKSVIAPYDFGRNLEQFNEAHLLKTFADLPKKDWSGATWPPNIVHRKVWELVGGYSIEFFPGWYSDPDFSMKLWQAGVRIFKGVSKSRAYHFMSVSTRQLHRKTIREGSRLFLQKWGMSSRVFCKYYLKRGEDYQGPLKEPNDNLRLKWELFRCKLKRRFL